MVEKYYIRKDGIKDIIGELHLDVTSDTYSAVMYDNYDTSKGYPTKLFGFKKGPFKDKFPFERIASHARVTNWLEDRVTPESRQLLEELLKGWKLMRYDKWEVLKVTNARYCNDPYYIEKFN